MGVSQNHGYLFGGAHKQDTNILGVYVGIPLFWETAMCISYTEA